MLENIFQVAGFIFLALLLYRYHRVILGALKRFDDENVARIARQEREKFDSSAHIRHTLEVADEQVEAVQEIHAPDARTGLPVTRFLFEAEAFATRDEAEAARAQRVGVIARRFYAELPQALMGRETGSPLSARERAARRWRRN
ncbi:MAG TPA: hypothetical protein VIJ72_07195 [Rhizomicrobium sp.]